MCVIIILKPNFCEPQFSSSALAIATRHLAFIGTSPTVAVRYEFLDSPHHQVLFVCFFSFLDDSFGSDPPPPTP